jgi:hypothetical protein
MSSLLPDGIPNHSAGLRPLSSMFQGFFHLGQPNVPEVFPW